MIAITECNARPNLESMREYLGYALLVLVVVCVLINLFRALIRDFILLKRLLKARFSPKKESVVPIKPITVMQQEDLNVTKKIVSINIEESNSTFILPETTDFSRQWKKAALDRVNKL